MNVLSENLSPQFGEKLFERGFIVRHGGSMERKVDHSLSTPRESVLTGRDSVRFNLRKPEKEMEMSAKRSSVAPENE
jgi:hypothetical protein